MPTIAAVQGAVVLATLSRTWPVGVGLPLVLALPGIVLSAFRAGQMSQPLVREPVAHPGFGEQVARPGRIRFELSS